MTEGKDYRFKSLINYAKELKEKKIEIGKSSKSNKNKFIKKMMNFILKKFTKFCYF